MIFPFSNQILLFLRDFLEVLEQPITANRKAYRYYYVMKEKLYSQFRKRRKTKRYLSSTLSRFQKVGYIATQILNGKKIYFLTPKGLLKIHQIKIKFRSQQKEKDGLLRIVIFDISEQEKTKREFLRAALKMLGFTQLQKSVWVSPDDVFEDLKLLVKDCDLEKNVKFILATEIEDQF